MGTHPDGIAIYSRKSRFTGKGESIGNQVELCRAYLRTAYGDDCADEAEVFEDEGFSGGNLNRPAFQRMMEAARARRFRAVVVYRLDRISRSISDFSALIQELGRLGVDFISIRESFDTTSPMGRAMMYIASVFSQLERETIAERIRDNMHELAKTGRWLGGVTPTGYTSEAVQSVTVDGKEKRACKLKVIPGEADLVRNIYGLYCRTGSLTGTEAELLRQHARTKTGRSFTRFSIKGILQNPVYLIADRAAYRYFSERQAEVFSPPEAFDGVRGILAYNRTAQEKGRATVYRPVREWIVAVGEHPGLIPSETWLRVQASLERNQSKTDRTPRNHEALLTGLLWCRCGSRMYPKRSGRPTAEGDVLFRYVCKGKERSRGALCGADNVSGNALDAAVWAQLRALEEDSGIFRDRLKERRFGSGGEDEGEELRREQVELRRRINALVDSLADLGESAAAGHVKERIEELHTRETALTERIARRKERADIGTGEARALCRVLRAFPDCLERMTVEQKRDTLRTLVRRVVWDGTCAHVVLVGAEEPEPPLCEDSK